MNGWLFLSLSLVVLVVVTFSFGGQAYRNEERKRGWRIRMRLGFVRYEEKIANQWVSIEMSFFTSAEGLHVQVPSETEWRQFPAWAAARRDDIVQRVKIGLKDWTVHYEQKA